MRLGYVLGVIFAFLVIGCDQAPNDPVQLDMVAVLTDVQAKFDAIPVADPKTKYDLRTHDGQKSLEAALAPYDAALNDSRKILTLDSYPDDFIPASDFDSDKSADSKSSRDVKKAAFLKRLARALGSRARLKVASGQTAEAVQDLEVTAKLVKLLGLKSDSILGELVFDAIRQIIVADVQEMTVESTLTTTDLGSLSRVVDELDAQPAFKRIVQAETMNDKLDATSDPKKKASEIEALNQISAACDQEAKNPAGTLAKLKRIAGPGHPGASAEDIQKATPGMQIYLAYIAHKRSIAISRMTSDLLGIIAYQDSSHQLPVTLPSKGRPAIDPFGGEAFSYAKTGNGFTISATASQGYNFLGRDGDLVKVSYPVTPYVGASL